MKIKVLLFAALAGRARQGRLELMLDSGATVSTAVETLLADRPELAAIRAGVLFAVNQQYVGLDHHLRDSDELAILPPVSGG